MTNQHDYKMSIRQARDFAIKVLKSQMENIRDSDIRAEYEAAVEALKRFKKRRTGTCVHCQKKKALRGNDICDACYLYKRRTGKPRPKHLYKWN